MILMSIETDKKKGYQYHLKNIKNNNIDIYGNLRAYQNCYPLNN